MLTFEKVLSVFHDYLEADPMYEVVLTGQGYTLLAWEPARNDWYNAKLAATPGILLEKLIEAYAGFQEDQITESERDLTPSEAAEIEAKCKQLRKQCQTA